VLKGDGAFTVSGLPWLQSGETKELSPDNLTANCLCKKHNSSISSLDSAALQFFKALKVSLEGTNAHSQDVLVSGHDIERWLLKTLKAMAVSRNLSRESVRLSGKFQSDVRIVDMLDDPRSWPQSTGLYCMMPDGRRMINSNRFQLSPLSGAVSGEIGGVWVNILGIAFVLMIEPIDLNKNPELRNAKYRPGEIRIKERGSVSTVGISWETGFGHPALILDFLSPSVS
jgi:hypothetical protein